MKVLVTGACGYLGGQIVEELVSHGRQVRALYRFKCHNDWSDNPNIELVKGDILDKDSLSEAVKNCAQIYHVAALSKSWSKDPSLYYKTNVEGTMNLIEVAMIEGINDIVITSSAGAIGPARKGDLVTETQERWVNFFDDYERSKALMNERVQEYIAKGANIRLVCPTRIFGPGSLLTDGSIVSKILKKYVGGRWKIQIGRGNAIGNYAFIRDVVQGHILAMENGRPGEAYLIGSFNASFTELFNEVDRITGKKQRLVKIPFFLISAYAIFVGALAKLFKFNPVITWGWTNKIRHNWATDLSKAKEELGYNPTSLHEAMEQTIEWIKRERK